jgi:hypothetical protein
MSRKAKFEWIRLAMCGAILGASLASILTDGSYNYELMGAVAAGVVTAASVKFFHLV